MAENDPLAHLSPSRPVPAGRYGIRAGAPGLVVRPVDVVAIVSIVARPKAGEIPPAAAAALGAFLPAGPRHVAGSGLVLIGTGPGRWLAIAETTEPAALAARLATALGGPCALTDQSDALALIDLSGPALETVLPKFVPVDLHPSVFGPDAAATTSLALIGATLWRHGDGMRFAVARSTANAFLRLVVTSGAEHGVELAAA